MSGTEREAADRRRERLELALRLEREALDAARAEILALRGAIAAAPAAEGPARALAVLGAAAAARGDDAEAIAALQAATAAEPGVPALWTALARARRLAGDLAGAAEAIDRAVALGPGERATWREAAEIAARGNAPAALAEALARFEPLRGRPDRDLHDIVRWAELSGDDALLERWLAAVAAAAPDGGHGRLAAAKLRHRRGDPDGARAALTDPVERARLEIEAGGRVAAGLELLRAAPAVEPRLLVKLAGVVRHRGHLGQAAALLRRALASGDPPAGAERELDRIEGELAVLRGGWAPAAPRVQDAGSPVRGRVLHLLARSRPHAESGFAVRSHNVLRAQRGAGLDPVAATWLGFPPAGPGARLELLDGIAYHRLAPGEPGPRRLDDALSVALGHLDDLTRRLRPAALQPATNFVNGLLALRLRERHGLPVVYEVRGFWEESWVARQPGPEEALESETYRGRRAREEACMLAADRVVTLGATMREALVARGVPRERITIVPNAVDPDGFSPAPADPALARRLGLEDAELILGYITTITRYEGIEYILRAVAALRARGRRVAALVVGDGRDRPRLERLAETLGLGGAAVFTGRVPHAEVQRYHALIDVFVVPRTNDRVCRLVTPLKPFEALALGRPVVVSDVPPLLEIVEPGRTGLSFRAEDADDLVATVEPLIDDPRGRAALGAAGREWVQAERTWRRNGERYRELMDDLGIA